MIQNTSKMHILVVDDETLIQGLLKSSLELIGYSVSLVSNGFDALCILAEKEFDMVLMDIRMPVMDGLTATKILRKCEKGEHLSLTEHHELAQSLYLKRKGSRTHVVALTGNIDDREIALQAGMDEHIPKPFKVSNICDVIDKFCGKSPKSILSERRRSPRHIIKNDSIVLCNGINGEIVDINESGLSVKYTTNHESIINEWSAICFNKTKKITTPYLPLKLVRIGKVESLSPSGAMTQTVGAIFNNPDESQQKHIKRFISHLS